MRYLGSKVKALEFIKDIVSKTYGDISGSTVADLFSGSVVVAEMFKSLGAKLITNDLRAAVFLALLTFMIK